MKPRNARCPHCRKVVEIDQPDFPFCSQRCRLIDLGQWLDGEFRVPGERVSLPEEAPSDKDRHQ